MKMDGICNKRIITNLIKISTATSPTRTKNAIISADSDAFNSNCYARRFAGGGVVLASSSEKSKIGYL